VNKILKQNKKTHLGPKRLVTRRLDLFSGGISGGRGGRFWPSSLLVGGFRRFVVLVDGFR
jgi:hypothetical protein